MAGQVPVLYSFRRCPYAIRARMALHSAGVAVELREVALRDKPAAMLAISAKATVPVLQLPDGVVIDESLAIMEWALGQDDPMAWRTEGEQDAQARHWTDRNDMQFKPLLDAYKYPQRHAGRSAHGHRDEALRDFVGPLNQQLHGRQYLLGEHPCWADVALFPFMRQFAMVDQAWFDAAPLPDLQRWLGGWLTSPQFVAVMDKRAPWVEIATDKATESG